MQNQNTNQENNENLPEEQQITHSFENLDNVTLAPVKTINRYVLFVGLAIVGCFVCYSMEFVLLCIRGN